MAIITAQDGKPQKKVEDESMGVLEKCARDLTYLASPTALLEECEKLFGIGKVGKKVEERRNDLFSQATYYFMAENGVLLSSIPTQTEQKKGLLLIRKRLIDEHGCTTAAELILVDQIAAGYWRLMRYELYSNRLPETDDGFSYSQTKINFLKEARQQIEQAQRQIETGLTMLRGIRQPQLKVNVKAENAYFAQNQQVVNEKPNEQPKDEPPLETIKP